MRVAVLFLFAALLNSCGGGDGGTTPPPPALVPSGASASGDTQTAVAGTTLPLSIAVIVTDQNGNDLANVQITWAVTTGGGTVNPASSTTGADGVAKTDWTLGPTAGQQTVTATVPSLGTLVFTATAVAGDAAGVAVTPGTVNLGALGATSQLGATLVDANGNAVTGGTFTWMTSDAALVTVDAAGLATAVANGTATITATSDALSGTGSVVVQQVAATVVVAPEDPTISIGSDQQMTAVVSDANGNAMAGATVGWTSSDAAIASVSGAGLVTGVAEGTATIMATSGNVTGTTTVTVILVPLPFEPTADQSIGGALTVAQVTIPAGVTITVTSDLVLNATGPVTVDGTLTGDCMAITVNGQAAVTITGTITNTCAVETDTPPDLLIVAGTDYTLDGATVTGAGDVEITNNVALSTLFADGRNAPFMTPSVLASFGTQAGTCTLNSSSSVKAGAGRNGADGTTNGENGTRGGIAKVACDGDLNMQGGSVKGGAGGIGGNATTEDGQLAVGGNGGKGGAGVLLISGNFNAIDGVAPSLVSGGLGGVGGVAISNGLTPGGSASATGGSGGGAGLPLITVGGVLGGRIRLFISGAGSGGPGNAIGGDGADATATTAAQVGGAPTARGGRGGSVGPPEGSPLNVIGNLLLGGLAPGTDILLDVGFEVSADGGVGNAWGGNGGSGSEQFKPGAAGGEMTALGAIGGNVNIIDNRTPSPTPLMMLPGFGGDALFRSGGGGSGFKDCKVGSLQAGGPGGPGGKALGAAGSAGTGGTASGVPGNLRFSGAGNGGPGGKGVPPGTGGAAGVDETILLGSVLGLGNSFIAGLAGDPCDETFDLVVTVLSDLNGHNPFTGATSVTQLPFSVFPNEQDIFSDGFESGDVGAWSSMTGSVSSPVPASGPAQAAGAFATATFSGTGIGTVAGFANVTQTLNGVLTLDADGRIESFTATLVLDSDNNKLPANGMGQRNPVSYTLTGTLPGG